MLLIRNWKHYRIIMNQLLLRIAKTKLKSLRKERRSRLGKESRRIRKRKRGML
jgi:hypothetical protein